MKIIKYENYIKEDVSDNSGLSFQDENKYMEVKDELRELIQNSLNTTDITTVNDYINAVIKDPENNKIEGLINDSDIYEFYLKYKFDIDEILSSIKFFDLVPSEMNVFGIYDYLIKGTNNAIIEFLNLIKSEVN